MARGVALRVGGRFDDALACLDQAMGDPDRHPGIIVAALGERADLLRLVGDDLAAQADIDRITASKAASRSPRSTRPGEPRTRRGPAGGRRRPGHGRRPGVGPPPAQRHGHARAPSGAGTTGCYEADVEAMLSAGQFGTAEHLLLGLIDAVEDEADEIGLPIDPSYFLTLADMLVHEKPPVRGAGDPGAARGSGRPSRRGRADPNRRRASPTKHRARV